MAAGGYASVTQLLRGSSVAITGAATTPVSEAFRMSDEDSIRFLARIVVTGVTVVGAITVKLQENWTGVSTDWEDVGTQANTSITADGTYEIQLLCDIAADAAQLPTAPLCRIVILTTNGGDAVTVSGVWVSRRR